MTLNFLTKKFYKLFKLIIVCTIVQPLLLLLIILSVFGLVATSGLILWKLTFGKNEEVFSGQNKNKV